MSHWFAILLAVLGVVACEARPRLCVDGVKKPTTTVIGGRPPWDEPTLMARWLVHASDWATIGTISDDKNSNVFGRVEDLSDGPEGMSTGRLLFYLANTLITRDIVVHENVTVVLSEAAFTGHCTNSGGAEMPTCAQVAISGAMRQVPENQSEEAQELVFARFPSMKDWPSDHAFQVYEVHIHTIRLLDYFGGPVYVDPSDYFAVPPSDIDRRPEINVV